MYEKFFGLDKAPFSIMPDPNCVYLTRQHEDAISGLVLGILQRKGYLVLTGEAGLGKTTALGYLSQLLKNENVQTSVIVNPTLTAPEFLEMAMLNFGLEVISSSKAQRLKVFKEFLSRSDAEGKVSALIVDEAHKLNADLLEEVRLLGNFDADDHKLLQIVLVGQTELIDRLNLPELWQLKQRIALRMSLNRLEPDAVAGYLKFRWEKAGGTGQIPFTEAAIDGIASGSNGIPRVVNAICDNSLLIAFSHDNREVDLEQVREACAELDLAAPANKQEHTTSLALRTGGPSALITAPATWLAAHRWTWDNFAAYRRTVVIGLAAIGLVGFSGLLMRDPGPTQGNVVAPAAAEAPSEGSKEEAKPQPTRPAPPVTHPTALPNSPNAAAAVALTPGVVNTASPAQPAAAADSSPKATPTGMAGSWTYRTNGSYQGAQPEVVEAIVSEENGRMSGTVFARFKDSPTLRFEFSGDARDAASQIFNLKGSDGAKGSIELKPGATPDQLQLSLQTQATDKPGQTEEIVLVKK